MTINEAITGIKNWCMKTEKDIVGTDTYIFIDNGSNVLAVGHADTVGMDRHNWSVEGNVVTSIALDDRLGLWIINDLLPEYGIVPDILITRDEEIGRSTAQFFETSKQYNWMFSFDRNSYDVVMYQYDNDDSRQLLQGYGFPVGLGSFSDISYLDHLGCIGFNFGTGYKHEHTARCYADVAQVLAQVRLFAQFYFDNVDTSMPYDCKADNGLDWYEWRCVYCNDILDYDNVSEDDPDICLFCESMNAGLDHKLYKDDLFNDDYNYHPLDEIDVIPYFANKKKLQVGDRMQVEEDGELIGGTVIHIDDTYYVVEWDDGLIIEEKLK